MIKFKPVACPECVEGFAWVYILQSADASLYTGSARDVALRLAQHSAGRGAKFTRDHKFLWLVYVEGPFLIKESVRREFQLKHWSRAKKEALITGNLGALRKLSQSRE